MDLEKGKMNLKKRRKRGKKGYAMTFDALLAVFLVIFTLSLIGFYYYSISPSEKTYFEQTHLRAEDSLQVLDNKGVLEQIGRYWASGNIQKANDTAKRYLDDMIPEQMGYRLVVAGENITMREGEIPESGSSDLTRATRLVSGYKSGATWRGYKTRAYLLWNRTNITRRLSREWNSSKREIFDVYFDDYRYANLSNPGFRENESLWLSIPVSATVSEARLNVSAGT